MDVSFWTFHFINHASILYLHNIFGVTRLWACTLSFWWPNWVSWVLMFLENSIGDLNATYAFVYCILGSTFLNELLELLNVLSLDGSISIGRMNWFCGLVVHLLDSLTLFSLWRFYSFIARKLLSTFRLRKRRGVWRDFFLSSLSTFASMTCSFACLDSYLLTDFAIWFSHAVLWSNWRTIVVSCINQPL